MWYILAKKKVLNFRSRLVVNRPTPGRMRAEEGEGDGPESWNVYDDDSTDEWRGKGEPSWFHSGRLFLEGWTQYARLGGYYVYLFFCWKAFSAVFPSIFQHYRVLVAGDLFPFSACFPIGFPTSFAKRGGAYIKSSDAAWIAPFSVTCCPPSLQVAKRSFSTQFQLIEKPIYFWIRIFVC